MLFGNIVEQASAVTHLQRVQQLQRLQQHEQEELTEGASIHEQAEGASILELTEGASILEQHAEGSSADGHTQSRTIIWADASGDEEPGGASQSSQREPGDEAQQSAAQEARVEPVTCKESSRGKGRGGDKRKGAGVRHSIPGELGGVPTDANAGHRRQGRRQDGGRQKVKGACKRDAKNEFSDFHQTRSGGGKLPAMSNSAGDGVGKDATACWGELPRPPEELGISGSLQARLMASVDRLAVLPESQLKEVQRCFAANIPQGASPMLDGFLARMQALSYEQATD